MTARTHTNALQPVRVRTRGMARFVAMMSAVALLALPLFGGLLAEPSFAAEPKPTTTTTVSPKETTTTTVSPEDTTTTTVSPKDTTTTTVSPKETTTTTVSPKETTTTTVSPKDTTTTTVSPEDTTTTTVLPEDTTTTTTKASEPESRPRDLYEPESPIIGLIPPISMVREEVREAAGPGQVKAVAEAPIVSVLGVQVERDQLPFTGPLGDSRDWAVLALALLSAGSAALAWVGRATSDRL